MTFKPHPVFRWLRSGTPYHAIFLLVYAIIIKYYYIAHPLPPVADPQADGGLYLYLLNGLKHLDLGTGAFAVLAFALLFIQALLLNSAVNRYKLLPGSGYFPAFCFLLFTSFFPEWNTFSAPLVANVILLIMLPQLFELYSTKQSKSASFSLGFLAGLSALIYMPLLILLLLIWVALLVSRPFRLAEWILVLMGMLCPYYFMGTVLFLTNNLDLAHFMPLPGLSYPRLSASPWILAGMALLILWFLIGSFRMQQDYMKMFIHVRKCWQILLAFIVVALALPFLPDAFSFSGWMIVFLPMSIFIAIGFWHIKKGWLALLIHGSALLYIFLIQWIY